MSDLKVTDLVNLPKKTYEDIYAVLKSLRECSDRYREVEDLNDPHILENIKKEFDGHMLTFAPLYAAVKKFKGSQHVYLDEVRKRIKSETLKMLLDTGVKVTAAGDLVYSDPYYVERVNLMEDIKEFMIKTEEYYDRYNTTFQAIVQSLSMARKEYENSKK